FEDRVVLDIGSLYIKVGLSGESKPRHIIPITMPVPMSGSLEASRSTQKLCGLYKLQLDPELEQFRRELLTDHLMAVYNKYLLTDPKQRKVIICESPLMPLPIKQMIASILFDILQVPSITFVPSTLLALLTTGKNTGLVVDCGHLETTVVPIYDGRPLIHMIHTVPLAGNAVTGRLKLLLKNHGSLVQDFSLPNPPSTDPAVTSTDQVLSPTSPMSPNYTSSTEPTAVTSGSTASASSSQQQQHLPDGLLDSITPETWEDLKARTCFVGGFPTFRDVSHDNREVAYPYRERAIPYTIYSSIATPVLWRVSHSERILVPGWVRERAAEVLFEGDDDGESVASVVLETLMRCPRDVRKELMKSILLVGGTAMMPGFQDRLMEHLVQFLEDPKRKFVTVKRLATDIKFLKTIFMANCMTWIGGSLVGALKTSGPEITLEAYLKDRRVPDWSAQMPAGDEPSAAPTTSALATMTSPRSAIVNPLIPPVMTSTLSSSSAGS
ncbi:hypothetical protein HDU76_007528, partial [Blyttiomyces sp. JEL0837]